MTAHYTVKREFSRKHNALRWVVRRNGEVVANTSTKRGADAAKRSVQLNMERAQ